MMITLGIEGTAHTLGVGIVDSDHNVLANELDMFKPKTGGLHPREAANHHVDVVSGIMQKALDVANLEPKDIDVISFSMGPGLGPCLRVAATAARAFSCTMGIPIVGVNHCVAHVEIGRALCGCYDPALLYASGGNTQIIAFAEGQRLRAMQPAKILQVHPLVILDGDQIIAPALVVPYEEVFRHGVRVRQLHRGNLLHIEHSRVFRDLVSYAMTVQIVVDPLLVVHRPLSPPA